MRRQMLVGPSCFAAILPVHSHKTCLKYREYPIKLTQAAVWRLGSSGKAIKAKSNLHLRPPLNQWQERTKIELGIEDR